MVCEYVFFCEGVKEFFDVYFVVLVLVLEGY